LELRSKICAMNESRFDFRVACAACAGGHMGDVQETLVDRNLPGGREARKFTIAVENPETTRFACHIARKACGNPSGKAKKRKWIVTRGKPRQTPPWPGRLAHRKLRYSPTKYHGRITWRYMPGCERCGSLKLALPFAAGRSSGSKNPRRFQRRSCLAKCAASRQRPERHQGQTERWQCR
jgi:hypothetical protein